MVRVQTISGVTCVPGQEEYLKDITRRNRNVKRGLIRPLFLFGERGRICLV